MHFWKLFPRLMVFVFSLGINVTTIKSQERPFIWVTKDEKESILSKIEKNEWTRNKYISLKEKTDVFIQNYRSDRTKAYEHFPYEENYQSFTRVTDYSSNKYSARFHLCTMLAKAVDASVLYFLTDSPDYAQFAMDVLGNFVAGLHHLKPMSEPGNGGWLYDNHLREAREIGAQLPIIYDFIYPYFSANLKYYDYITKALKPFPKNKAQQVFEQYAFLAVDRGHRGSNWSVLEAPSLVQNALALENEAVREKYIEIYLEKGSSRQDALSEVAANYKNKGDVFPESSQYSRVVPNYSSILMRIVQRIYPHTDLVNEYQNLLWSMDGWDKLVYPNGEMISLGDGNRPYSPAFRSFEIAYLLAEEYNLPELKKHFGNLLKHHISEGKYDRHKTLEFSVSASVYFDPLEILWYSDSIIGNALDYKLPPSVILPHAGAHLLRNLSEGEGKDLMGVIYGGSYVHGHASGMAMELYGEGLVLGADGGKEKYTTDIHENYYRIFAAHNTVIVNGASRGEGDWVNLGINQVETIAMEPYPESSPVSPNHSFVLTSFKDDRGDRAEADQRRLLALIRTSDSSGYYLDLFQSDSKLSPEYHDYLYHNIGDEVKIIHPQLVLNQDPDRFARKRTTDWVQNRSFHNPGWHYFDNVYSTSLHDGNVLFQFSLIHQNAPKFMNVHIPGGTAREYSTAFAPRTYGAPSPYHSRPTPTIIMRRYGQAWRNPFISVYESYSPEIRNATVQNVNLIQQDSTGVTLEINSLLGSHNIKQVALIPFMDQSLQYAPLGLECSGHFTLLTLDPEGQLKSFYLGSGSYIKVKGLSFKSVDNRPFSMELQMDQEDLRINSNKKVMFSQHSEDSTILPSGTTIIKRSK